MCRQTVRGSVFLRVFSVVLGAFLAVGIPLPVAAQGGDGWFYGALGYSGQALYRQMQSGLEPANGTVRFALEAPWAVEIVSWIAPGDAEMMRQQLSAAMAEQLLPVRDALLGDHPELFWPVTASTGTGSVSTFLAVSEQEGGYRTVGEPGALVAEVLQLEFQTVLVDRRSGAKRDALQAAATQLLAEVPPGSPHEQLQAVHRLLLAAVRPASELDDARHTGLATGALVDGAATSAGYARAFQLLCAQLPEPVPCVSAGDGQRMWNLVQLGSGWYLVDPERNDREAEEGDWPCFLAGEQTVVGGQAAGETYRPQSPHGFALPQPEPDAYGTAPPPAAGVLPDGAVVVLDGLTYGDPLGSLTLVGSFCTDDEARTPIAGRLEWDEPDRCLSAGGHAPGYTFYPENTALAPYLGTMPVVVAAKPLTVTPLGGACVYNGTCTPQDGLAYTHSELALGDLPGEVFSGALVLEAAAPGRRQILQGSLLAGANYTLVFTGGVVCQVLPRPLTITGATVASRQYNGTADASVTALELAGLLPGEEVEATCRAAFANSAAGTQKPVEVVVEALSGPHAANYSLPQAGVFTAADIEQYPAAHCPPHRLLFGQGSGSFGLLEPDDFLPEGPGQSGQRAFAGPLTVSGEDFFSAPPTLLPDGSGIRYTTAGSLQPGQTASLTVQLRSGNYEEITVTAQFEATGRETVTIGGVALASRVYDGQPVALAQQPVFRRENGAALPLPYTCTYTGTTAGGSSYHAAAPPRQAGSYQLTVLVDTPDYHGRLDPPVAFEIWKAELLIVPQNVELMVGAPLPGSYRFDYQGFAPGDTPAVLDSEPAGVTDLADTARPAVGAITVREPLPQADNYHVRARAGTLTVRAVQPNSTHYSVTARSRGEWHNRAIQITPARREVFDQIALSPTGPFGPAVTLEGQTAAGKATLYFRKGDASPSPGLEFRYQLDTAAPLIRQVRCEQVLNREQVKLWITAEDALSGVAERTVTGPGDAVVAADGAFCITQEGRYRIAVSDHAGNTAAVEQLVSIRRVEAVQITRADGAELSGVLYPRSGERLAAVVTGSALPEDYTLRWSSSDPDVVAVGPDGALTLYRQGSCVITAQAMEQSASCRVTAVLPVPGSNAGGTGGTGGTSSADKAESYATREEQFWESALDRVVEAAPGSTVNIAAGSYAFFPAEILWALQGRAVSLHITRSGQSAIELFGEQLPPTDPAVEWYTMTELAALAISPSSPSADSGETDQQVAAPPSAQSEGAAATRAAAAAVDTADAAVQPEEVPEEPAAPFLEQPQPPASTRQESLLLAESTPPPQTNPPASARTGRVVLAVLLIVCALGLSGVAILQQKHGE